MESKPPQVYGLPVHTTTDIDPASVVAFTVKQTRTGPKISAVRVDGIRPVPQSPPPYNASTCMKRLQEAREQRDRLLDCIEGQSETDWHVDELAREIRAAIQKGEG